MKSLSVCSIVRNGFKLKYPLEASIQTYYPICDEVVIAYDPDSEDETAKYVRDLARRYPKIRPIPSPWNMTNHDGGTEITLQSNVAVEACSSDWILYVQADEAIHEGDHAAIRAAMELTDLNGALFDRRSFLGALDSEIPDYFAQNLLRLFRNGKGYVVGDGMTCGLVQGVSPRVPAERFRMFNYSRMGSREEVLLRSRYRDNFHTDAEKDIQANAQREFTQQVTSFSPEDHPASIRECYRESAGERRAPETQRSPVTLGVLMGPEERENLVPFFWQFRDWPGDVVVIDDMTVDGSSSVLEAILGSILHFDRSRYTILRSSVGGDFAQARNRLQEAAKAPWVFMPDLDERWDPSLIRDLPRLIAQLDQDGIAVCGFPRANFVDGILVNDVPTAHWTPTGLLETAGRSAWPPNNPDVQHRLTRREERWQGKLHERPGSLLDHSGRAVVLRDHWILHNKSLARQRRQDELYASFGQPRGLPDQGYAEGETDNLREKTLCEVMRRMPRGRIVVVETGTLRDPSPKARITDGWSTYCLAEQLAARNVPGSQIYSIDINPDHIAVSKRIVPRQMHPWVTWITSDSCAAIERLQCDVIDLLYLDSSDDPRLILSEFEVARPKLRRHSIVVVDDTGPYHVGPEGKGSMVIPALRRQGWKVERRDNDDWHMVIMTQS
jgi:glycosyltransferase involved in cell wall biosynthesis